MDVRDDVRSHITEFLEGCGIDHTSITDESRLADADIDSLELVALMQILQRRYDIPLNDDRLIGLETVGQLVDLVETRIGGKLQSVLESNGR